jgi:hypothetical protein
VSFPLRHAPAGLLLAVATTFVSAIVRADEPPPRLAVTAAERPLTLPAALLAPSGAFAVHHRGRTDDATFADLDLSARFGVTDDLTVHALVAPLQLSTTGSTAPPPRGFAYGQPLQAIGPNLGGTYRFVRGDVELGAGVTGTLSTVPGRSGGIVTPSIPLHVHATPTFRIDVRADLDFRMGDVTSTGLFVPAGFVVNPSETSAVSVTSGLTIFDLGNAKTSTGIPFGMGYAYTFATARGPAVDVGPQFNFPYLVMPGRRVPGNTSQFMIGLAATGYLYL